MKIEAVLFDYFCKYFQIPEQVFNFVFIVFVNNMLSTLNHINIYINFLFYIHKPTSDIM